MKTVEMDRDFAYIPHPSTTMMFYAGVRYVRVPEAAVVKIVAAGAGRIVEPAAQAAIVEVPAPEPLRVRRKSP